ncbi:hypothetical protein Tco_0109896 [Tanacetum coccineum]
MNESRQTVRFKQRAERSEQRWGEDMFNVGEHEIDIFPQRKDEIAIVCDGGDGGSGGDGGLDFQDNSDDEIDERTSEEYLRDLDIEFMREPFWLEDVSDDEEMVQVKVLMALANYELVVGKNHARNGEWIDITMRKRHIKEPIWYLDSGCSRSMTGVKSYLHKYVEQPGPMIVFGDNSSCITEEYSSINCDGIVFSKVAFANRLKNNLISISQLCDAKYII